MIQDRKGEHKNQPERFRNRNETTSANRPVKNVSPSDIQCPEMTYMIRVAVLIKDFHLQPVTSTDNHHGEPSMNQSPNRRTFGSSGKSRKNDVNLDLSTARQMLPLVRSIVRDIVASQDRLTRLQPEQDRLDRHRVDLVWQERERRYQVSEEIAETQKHLAAVVGELKQLGLSLSDDNSIRIDFPTRINGRHAAYSWQNGEEDVTFWHYAEENDRRPIPTDWMNTSAAGSKNKK